jgi:SnoaL-like domain
MPTDLQTCFELAQAKSRYCRLMDTKDWTGVADLLTEDLVFDLGGGDDAPPIVGRDAALNAVQSSIVDAVTVHQVHSPEFEINGDEARVVWAAQDRVKWHNGAGLIKGGPRKRTFSALESGILASDYRALRARCDVCGHVGWWSLCDVA